MTATSSLPSEGNAVSSIENRRHQDEEDLQVLLATDLDRYFPALVSRYEGQLIAHAYCRLGVRQDAEEVVQESFERAYYALKGYSHQRIRILHLQAWLYTI